MRVAKGLIWLAIGVIIGLGVARFTPSREKPVQPAKSDLDRERLDAELRRWQEHWQKLTKEWGGKQAAQPQKLIDALHSLRVELLRLTELPSDTNLPALVRRIIQERDELQEQLRAAREALLAATAVKDEPPPQELVAYAEDLHRERLEHQGQLDELLRQKDEEIGRLADRLKSLATRLQQERQSRREIELEMLRQVDRLRAALEGLKKYVPPPLEIQRQKADGKIVRANNAKGIAWINLGSREHVRPGITFSVWSALDSVAIDRPKAKLMVTRVIDRGLSEARILECDPRHPVVPGDLIASVAWAPGTRPTFVLAGVIDLDGDGEDDRAIVKNAIHRQGGEVVAELLPDGTVIGHLTPRLRYFVRGSVTASHARAAMERLEQEARDYGAYIIDVDKLADYLGISLAALRRRQP